MIVTTKKLFEAAYGKYAIGAYNINNLEQTIGLLRGNLRSQAIIAENVSNLERTTRELIQSRNHLRDANGALEEMNRALEATVEARTRALSATIVM